MTDIATIAGPVPKGFRIKEARQALRRPDRTDWAFDMTSARQGIDYWVAYRRDDHPNPDEARAILRYWIERAEASATTAKEPQ